MRLRRNQSARWQQVPEGVRDLPPAEAERRSALAAVLREEFQRWGYREVVTPTLEFLDTIVRGAGPGVQDQLFKIVDGGGELLALRPEMTVPIARLAASRLLQGATGPLRLAYVTEVFRGQEAGRGRLREFTQAGVELLGDRGLDADAEVLALAAECLRRAGVEDAILNVGELGFLDDLLAELGEDEKEDVRMRLYRKEFAGIESAVANAPLARFLRALPDLHGSDAIASARAYARSARSREALDRLQGVLERLREYGVAERVGVDLSIIRDFSYYTGIVFEAYRPGMGYPLLGGGRYDGLLARFGADCPATGFAIGLERVLAVLPEAPGTRLDVLVVGNARTRPQAVALAMEMRRLGKQVVVAIEAEWTEALQRAEAEGIRWVVRTDGEQVRLYEAGVRREHTVGRDELLAELTARPGSRVMAWTH